MLNQFVNKIKVFIKNFKELSLNQRQYTPSYKVISIDQNAHGEYEISVQMINKARVFMMKPEDILADDNMTDSFSPRDIRTLTYLGYLDLNSPKYRILARRVLENDQKVVFAIQEKGKKKPIVKTAEEISTDESLIQGLAQKDAHSVGYTAASEQFSREQLEKQALIEKGKDKQ